MVVVCHEVFLLNYKIQCYRLLESDVTGFQNSVLPALRNQVLPAFILKYQLRRYLVYNLFSLF